MSRRYYQHLKAIGHQLFPCFALAFRAKKTFDFAYSTCTQRLRLIHYPFNPQDRCEGIDALILLLPTAPSLQVLTKPGEWIDIPHLSGMKYW